MLQIMSGDLGKLGLTQNNCSLNSILSFLLISFISAKRYKISGWIWVVGSREKMKDVPRSCGSGNPAFRRKDPCYLCGAPPDLGNPTVKNCFKSNYRNIGSYNFAEAYHL